MKRGEATIIGLAGKHRESCGYLSSLPMRRCNCDLGHGTCNIHGYRPCPCDDKAIPVYPNFGPDELTDWLIL